jgi:hypothetical protein
MQEQEYEIRVFGERERDLSVYQSIQCSIAKAIGEGRKIAGGHPFEVWRETHCIFTSRPNP